jgi:hypothetical protein
VWRVLAIARRRSLLKQGRMRCLWGMGYWLSKCQFSGRLPNYFGTGILLGDILEGWENTNTMTSYVYDFERHCKVYLSTTFCPQIFGGVETACLGLANTSDGYVDFETNTNGRLNQGKFEDCSICISKLFT